MTDTQERGRRGRPTRAEAMFGARKRRNDNLGGGVQRLVVPNHVKEQYPGCSFRYVNESDARMYNMTSAGDYQVVSVEVDDRPDSATGSVGGNIRVPVGRTKMGDNSHAVLCATPEKWYREDQSEKQKAIDERMGQLRRGPDNDPNGIGATGHHYIPQGGITVKE